MKIGFLPQFVVYEDLEAPVGGKFSFSTLARHRDQKRSPSKGPCEAKLHNSSLPM